ncbi:hypothetical protein C8F01DRAFT_302497 [Mycena amicta]|nr:hypothetical protein C8F01DRAFT_302497 [Mycena amicta]
MKRQRSSQRPASALLPIELWELVLDEASDESLIVLARVCRVLNELAMRVYFHRNSIDVSKPTLSIRSHLIRSLFVLVCEPPHITSLKCTFWSFGAGRGILMLREVVKNWPSLTQIHLVWPQNVLSSMRSEMEDNYTKEIPATLYFGALWELISVVAKKSGGPLVLVGGGSLHRYDADALASAILCYTEVTTNSYAYEPRPGILVRALNTLRRRSKIIVPPAKRFRAGSQPHFVLRAKAVDIRVDHIEAIHIRPLDIESMQLKNATLLEFDMRSLTLQPNESFSAADISALLPRITLPSLTILELGSSDIDPSALSAFIEHHPQLQTFKLACSWGSVGPLCSPPVAPLGLSHIVCHNDVADIAVLLDTFDTEAMVPCLSYVAMTLRRTTPHERTALSRALVRLGLRRPTATTYLELVLPPDFASTPPPEGRRKSRPFAASLTCPW